MSNPLVTDNLRLVYTVAKSFHCRGLDYADLVQEGNIGLIKAAERFDPSKGLKFSTYACFWIKAHILIAIRNSGTVRVSNDAEARAIFWKHAKVTKQLEREGIEPTSAAIAERLSVSVEAVDAVGARLHPRDVNLDAQVVAGESDRTYADFFASDAPSPEDNAAAKETDHRTSQSLERALSLLNIRERRIIRSRHMQDDPETLQEIGDWMGLSRERVRQIEAKALGKLRGILRRAA